jgi:DNA-directed RNA polymerase specialized sigma24 family protein
MFFPSAATNKTKRIALNSEIQNSDERFLELIRGNQPRILKVCRVYAWNQKDQDDLYQEMLFQIWRSLPNLKADSFANTWIYRIALNTAISFVRKRVGRNAKTVPYDHHRWERGWNGNMGVMLHRAKKKLAVLMKEASHEG